VLINLASYDIFIIIELNNVLKGVALIILALLFIVLIVLVGRSKSITYKGTVIAMLVSLVINCGNMAAVLFTKPAPGETNANKTDVEKKAEQKKTLIHAGITSLVYIIMVFVFIILWLSKARPQLQKKLKRQNSIRMLTKDELLRLKDCEYKFGGKDNIDELARILEIKNPGDKLSNKKLCEEIIRSLKNTKFNNAQANSISTLLNEVRKNHFVTQLDSKADDTL